MTALGHGVATGRHRAVQSSEQVRVRSAWVIASVSAGAVAVPTILVTGSPVLALLVAAGTVLAVALAGLVI